MDILESVIIIGTTNCLSNQMN